MQLKQKISRTIYFLRNLRHTILLFCLILLFNSSFAQTIPKDTSVNNREADPKPKTAHVEVYEAYKFGNKLEDGLGDSVGIDEIVVLKVHNLGVLMDRSKGIEVDGKVTREKKIRLFLDGRMIEDLDPESGAAMEDKGELRFHLRRTPKNDEAWADILGSPKNDEFFYRKTNISVGLEGEFQEQSVVKNFYITRAKKNWFYGCAIGLLLYFAGLFVLARKSNVLKDNAFDARSIGIQFNPTYNHYSLGKFQMAFWFSLVLVSYLFIWLITGATDIISAGVLGLIGISAGTALSAVVINNSKSTELLKQTVELQTRESGFQQEIEGIDAEIASLPNADHTSFILSKKVIEDKLKQVQIEISKNILALTPNKKSQGFMLDVLSDENGVSFHRLQMFVWTLVLGLLFVHSVWTRLSMLEFSATLLALQGLTAGTYLGFKIPEKQV